MDFLLFQVRDLSLGLSVNFTFVAYITLFLIKETLNSIKLKAWLFFIKWRFFKKRFL